MKSKQKGNTFERKIANKLSERFASHLGIPNGFRRNPDSGSFFGGKNVARVATHSSNHAALSDIICPDDFNFLIECKHYKSAPSFKALLKMSIEQWDQWIAQLEQNVKVVNKQPMLVIKYNNSDMFALVTSLPEGSEHSFKYKNYYVVLFDQILNLEDSFFFSQESA